MSESVLVPPAAPTAPAEAPLEPTSPSPPPPPRPKPKRRGLLIAGVSIGIVVALLLGGFLFLLTPPSRAEFQDPVDAETRSINAALYASLVAAGVDNPFVDASSERVYVAYTLPEESRAQADTYQRFVIGSSADASPASEYIYAFQYIANEPFQLWIVAMSDFLAYIDGTSTAAEFDAKIQKVSF
jgi:hypothetical protein